MASVRLEAGRLLAHVRPDLGGGLGELSVRGPDGALWPLLRRAPEDASYFNELACYTLAPWCNRIAGAAFEFAGRTHPLRADWPDGTAIHGAVKDKPWRMLDRTPASVRLRFDSREHADVNFPFPFACEARYELDEGGLTVGVRTINTGEEAMPAACGFHPFFVRRLWDEGDRVEVRLPVSGRYPAEGMIPTGPARDDEVSHDLRRGGALEAVAGGVELDDVFDGFAGPAEVCWPASGVAATVEGSEDLAHAVIYSARRGGEWLPWFCLEPVGMVNDGINLLARGWAGTGVRVLEPGGVLDSRMRIGVRLAEMG